MGFRSFFAAAAVLLSLGKVPDYQALRRQHECRSKRAGGLGRFSAPSRCASRKSVQRFWGKVVSPERLEMRMKNVLYMTPAARRERARAALRKMVAANT